MKAILILISLLVDFWLATVFAPENEWQTLVTFLLFCFFAIGTFSMYQKA